MHHPIWIMLGMGWAAASVVITIHGLRIAPKDPAEKDTDVPKGYMPRSARDRYKDTDEVFFDGLMRRRRETLATFKPKPNSIDFKIFDNPSQKALDKLREDQRLEASKDLIRKVRRFGGPN